MEDGGGDGVKGVGGGDAIANVDPVDKLRVGDAELLDAGGW
jgi:hypothetical protein